MSSSPIPSAPLKIALIGTRGIPANYGGFETFAEELSTRLARRGHEVTVFGRTHYVDRRLRYYRGVHLRVLPAIRHKYLETVTHSTLAVLDSMFRPFDVVLVCNAANAFLCWLPRLLKRKVVLNVDGIERRRKKWNRMGRIYLQLSERLAAIAPNAVVTDARVIEEYYLHTYGCRSHFIPYGASTETVESSEILEKYGLERSGYLLYVSRLEPENNAHLVIEGYRRSGVEVPLVLVGSAPYANKYLRRLQKLAEGANVLLTGAIYGVGYRELLAHCLCYFHATEVGGTHPALIEAMGAGCLVVVHDTPENREVVGEAGLLCRFDDLESLAPEIRRICERPWSHGPMRDQARARIQEVYDWEEIVDRYERLFHELGSSDGR